MHPVPKFPLLPKAVVALGIVLSLTQAPAFAADPMTPPGAAATAAEPVGASQGPLSELKSTTEKLRGMIAEHHAEYRADMTKFYGIVDDLVVPRFDVPFIAKHVLGVHYREASADQRTRFADGFKNMLIRNYADALLDNYDSAAVDWQTPRMADGQEDTIVNAGITKKDGQKVTIGFRVHVVDSDWKVWDIVVENISLDTNFKTQIDAEIKKTSLDAVIDRMQKGEVIGGAAPGAK